MKATLWKSIDTLCLLIYCLHDSLMLGPFGRRRKDLTGTFWIKACKNIIFKQKLLLFSLHLLIHFHLGGLKFSGFSLKKEFCFGAITCKIFKMSKLRVLTSYEYTFIS